MGSEKSFAALIQEARDGHRRAIDEILDRCRDSVAAFIHFLLGSSLRQKIEIDDLIQDTFLRAFRSVKQFRGSTEISFRSWLTTIAGRVVRGQARSLDIPLPVPGGASSANLIEALESCEPSPSKFLRRQERFEHLESALRSLSPDHRKVILLTRVQGLSVKEAARRMNRSPEAVSMLLLRALEKLKGAFGRASSESLRLPDRRLDIGELGGEG